MDEIKNEVMGDVTRLLSMLESSCDPETFMFVRDRLTQMVIVSVPPPNCRLSVSKPSQPSSAEDFSAQKERFIAP